MFSHFHSFSTQNPKLEKEKQKSTIGGGECRDLIHENDSMYDPDYKAATRNNFFFADDTRENQEPIQFFSYFKR